MKPPAGRRTPASRIERRRERTRSEIVDAARDVVLRSGLAGFTLADVADQLGLTKPALYYYFDSKDSLLFEVLLREWAESAAEVQAAVGTAESGADAVEQMMRTVFDHYRDRLELYLLHAKLGPGGDFRDLVGPEELARIHPLNEMFYGGAEARLRADQSSGGFPRDRDPRRFAFTAHMAVLGLLNMKAVAMAIQDPLVHGDQALIDDLCATFRATALQGGAT